MGACGRQERESVKGGRGVTVHTVINFRFSHFQSRGQSSKFHFHTWILFCQHLHGCSLNLLWEKTQQAGGQCQDICCITVLVAFVLCGSNLGSPSLLRVLDNMAVNQRIPFSSRDPIIYFQMTWWRETIPPNVLHDSCGHHRSSGRLRCVSAKTASLGYCIY
jgi:hypothetical protein